MGCDEFFFADASPIDYDSNRERREAFLSEIAGLGMKSEVFISRG